MGTGTQTGSGDPTTRDPIKRVTVPEKPLKRSVEMSESERVSFRFYPSAPEEWRSNAPAIIQLFASRLMSREEGRQRLGLGPVKTGEEFAPEPTQMTPGQANKITTNPRTQAGLPAPKGVVSKPPEQQEKPKEVSTGSSGVSMPQLVSDEPIIQPLGTPKKKKSESKKYHITMNDDESVDIEEKTG